MLCFNKKLLKGKLKKLFVKYIQQKAYIKILETYKSIKKDGYFNRKMGKHFRKEEIQMLNLIRKSI
jgi:hypothetical protein